MSFAANFSFELLVLKHYCEYILKFYLYVKKYNFNFKLRYVKENNIIFQLVSNALQFLATVADRTQYRHLFEDPATLGSICEKVIIPNMEFRGKV